MSDRMGPFSFTLLVPAFVHPSAVGSPPPAPRKPSVTRGQAASRCQQRLNMMLHDAMPRRKELLACEDEPDQRHVQLPNPNQIRKRDIPACREPHVAG